MSTPPEPPSTPAAAAAQSPVPPTPPASAPPASAPAAATPAASAPIPPASVPARPPVKKTQIGTAAAADEAAEAAKRPAATLTAFTVQCSSCYKWRKVPTLEEYESIRARVSAQPFTCAQARRWRPNVSCADEPDLVQDGSLLWAMDRQDIPQPPPGWRRRIVVRGGTSAKFSDVYYHSPCGKTLRSVNDVERFLSENAKYKAQGVTAKQFSFSSPRPLTSSSPAARTTPSKRSQGDHTPSTPAKKVAV